MSTTTVDRILIALKAMVTDWKGGRPTFLSVTGPRVRRNNGIHCVKYPQVREMHSFVSYSKKVADPPERKILNVADQHFSQCGRPACEGEQCDALCGRPTSDGNVS